MFYKLSVEEKENFPIELFHETTIPETTASRKRTWLKFNTWLVTRNFVINKKLFFIKLYACIRFSNCEQ